MRARRWDEVCYEYDGTLDGLLACVFESYANKEEAVCFHTFGEEAYTLWPTRRVETDPVKAGRVFRSIGPKMGEDAVNLVCRGFLTCLPEKELHIYRFLRYGYERGAEVTRDLGDDRVNVLYKAVRQLNHEAHLYTGFVRFIVYDEVLMAEIEPKNQVLPLIRSHFVNRYNNQQFLIYDHTNQQALIYRPRESAIVPVSDMTFPAASEIEIYYRRLWRRFYDTIEIKERHNEKGRMTHIPKRYWNMMTEFQTEEKTELPI